MTLKGDGLIGFFREFVAFTLLAALVRDQKKENTKAMNDGSACEKARSPSYAACCRLLQSVVLCVLLCIPKKHGHSLSLTK